MFTQTPINASDYADSQDNSGSTAPNHDTVAQINGHTVVSKKPDRQLSGSADREVCFECVHCGETAHPHENRCVSDAEWAENYFQYFACVATSNQVSNVEA